MKLSLPRNSIGSCLLALAAALILPAPATHAAPVTFFANLSGANETPPTGSPKRVGNKTQRSACRRGTKVPAPSCGFAGAVPGEDVMAKLINELLLLTCMGAFIASATYAVTLLH